MSDLKPCPFCDGPAKIISGFGQKHSFTATCDSLDECLGQHMEQDEQGGFTADYRTEEDAVKAWNTRAAPKVKPLEWGRSALGYSFADIYEITPSGSRLFINEVVAGDLPETVESLDFDVQKDQGPAKAAAQTHYERRILSALTPETET